jgi:hypothetical protein
MKSAVIKKKVIEELKKTPVVEVACAKTGIGRTAFYEWKKKDPKFAAAVDAAVYDGRDFISDIAEGQLMNMIKMSDYRSIRLWLKTYRAEYRNRLEIEGTLETVREMTPEQVEKSATLIALAKAFTEHHESE